MLDKKLLDKLAVKKRLNLCVFSLFVSVALTCSCASAAPSGACNQVDRMLQDNCQLLKAMQSKSYERVQKIISDGYVDLNNTDVSTKHQGPRTFAEAARGDARLLDILFSNGFDPNLRIVNGTSEILDAQYTLSSQAIFEKYLKAGLDLDGYIDNGVPSAQVTVLQYIAGSCGRGNAGAPLYYGMLQTALNSGAKIDKLASNDANISHIVAEGKNVSCLKVIDLLISKFPNTFPMMLNAKDATGRVPSDYAITIAWDRHPTPTSCARKYVNDRTVFNALIARRVEGPTIPDGAIGSCVWHIP
jgi:hypothetical protein